jgi:hypothetical protein
MRSKPKEEPLPTVGEMRAKARDQVAREKQEAFERRFKARQILFGKGHGFMKNLSEKDIAFIRSVEHESYQLYRQEFVTGKSRYNVGKAWSRTTRRLNGVRKPTTPMKFVVWRWRWWCSQKNRYMHFDIPLMMKRRMEDLRLGRTA